MHKKNSFVANIINQLHLFFNKKLCYGSLNACCPGPPPPGPAPSKMLTFSCFLQLVFLLKESAT